ncbi:MAG: DNA-processing protein DprA [Ginsengibacter sp.]
MKSDVLYQIALTLVPNIGDVISRELINRFGSAENIFKAKKKDLEAIEGMGSMRVNAILNFSNFKAAEEEVKFIEKYKIEVYSLYDERYPQRFLNCYDPPLLLYFKGNADLNASKIIGIVGTRKNSDYGKQLCEKVTEELSQEDVIIVSGLAFGIDTIAHKSALKNGLKTIGVVGHGLDRIYPSENKSLAKAMIENGGILSEFKSGTNPDKQNFPRRNRIVAGICDAILVVESSIKGGSLITAEVANGYNKDVFAFPGRTTDVRSEGCNYLIKSNKAALASSGFNILEALGWMTVEKKKKQQRELFFELSEEERTIINILQFKEQMHIDELYLSSGLSSSSAASVLLNLEVQGLISSLPGKLYRIN